MGFFSTTRIHSPQHLHRTSAHFYTARACIDTIVFLASSFTQVALPGVRHPEAYKGPSGRAAWPNTSGAVLSSQRPKCALCASPQQLHI